MNVDIIREALTLARAVVWESMIAHHRLGAVKQEAEVLRFASELAEYYDDCAALVAIDRALRELAAPSQQQGEAGR